MQAWATSRVDQVGGSAHMRRESEERTCGRRVEGGGMAASDSESRVFNTSTNDNHSIIENPRPARGPEGGYHFIAALEVRPRPWVRFLCPLCPVADAPL